MKKISMEDAVTLIAGTAILEVFEKQVRELYPSGVEALRVVEKIQLDQFPNDQEFDGSGKEFVKRLVDDIIADLAQLGSKYVE